MKLLLCALFIALALPLSAAPISPQTHANVLLIGRALGVPDSVSNWLQVEESGDRFTGEWGDACAVSKRASPAGYHSLGLYQLYAEPAHMAWLLARFWPHKPETFDPFNPLQSAVVGLGYVRWLHDVLGSWYLAACAYNAGRGRVLSGEIWLDKYAETRAYAARIVAAGAPTRESASTLRIGIGPRRRGARSDGNT